MRRLLILLVLPVALLAQTPEQLFQAGKFDEAKVAFQAQLARDKNDANAMYYLGRIAVVQDKGDDAIDWFEKAIKRNDQSAQYHLWLGNAVGDAAQKASKLRQPFLARRVKKEFERAVELDPKLIDARLGLVDFYSIAPGFMGGSMDKAREQTAEILKLNAMQGHFAEARLAQRQKDLVAAEKAFQAAVAVAPDSAAPYTSLAGFYRRQSRWDEAFATYEHLMKVKPDDPYVHALWGITAAASGRNLERGEREIKTWLANAPKDASALSYSNVHYRLGNIYEKTNRRDLAKAEYTEAIKFNAKNEDAKKALDALK